MKFIRAVLGCTSATFVLAVATSAYAQTHSFDIPSEDAAKSLPEFARQAGIQLVAPVGQLHGVQTPAVHGSYDRNEALKRLLIGTGLEVSSDNGSLITLRRSADVAPKADDTSKNIRAASTNGAAVGGNLLLETVIVSAEKKTEQASTVPVPLTVLDPQVLVATNQTRLQDYFDQVPGISVAPVAQGQLISIRGINTGSTGNSTVGITIDDAPYGATTSQGGGQALPDIDPGDLERIEVLRGPQGTLYGSSSMGGLIKFVTIDPSLDAFSGRLQAGLSGVSNGGDIGFSLRGSVNVPLSDSVAVRASAFTSQVPGYIDNPIRGLSGLNEEHVSGGRIATLIQVTDDVSVKLSAIYQDDRRDGNSDVDVQANLGDLQQNYLPGTGVFHRTVQAYSGTINADMGWAKLASVSSININTIQSSVDLSSSLSALTNFCCHATGSPVVTNTMLHKYSEEARLSGSVNENIDWLVGGFYTYETTSNLQNIEAADPNTGTVVGTLVSINFPVTYQETAGFADFTYRFSDRFDIQFGGRESHIDQSSAETDTGASYATLLGTTSPIVKPNGYAHEDAFTYLVTPRFKITPDFMAYARFASGYRAGGTNAAVGVPSTQYNPDQTRNYEIGIKTDLLDHMLTLDGSLFYIDWKGIQLSVTDPKSGQGYTVNASRAKSQGAELSATLRPFTGTTLGSWISYNDAYLTSAFPTTASVHGAVGDALPYTSRMTGALTADQDIPVSEDLTGYVGGSANFVGPRYGNFVAASLVRQRYPSYNRIDLHAGVKFDTWNASVYVNNVGDERGLLSGGIGASPTFSYQYITPRTVGLTVVKTF